MTTTQRKRGVRIGGRIILNPTPAQIKAELQRKRLKIKAEALAKKKKPEPTRTPVQRRPERRRPTREREPIQLNKPQPEASTGRKIIRGIEKVAEATNIAGRFEEETGEQLITGTVPIGGAGVGVIKGFTTISKNVGNSNLFSTATRGSAIGNIPKGALNILKSGAKSINTGLGKVLGSPLGKVGAGVGGALSSVDVLMVWMASDNIIQALEIFSRDLNQAATRGDLPVEVVVARLEETERIIAEAKSFIKISTMINPMLWAFRPIISLNLEKADLILNSRKADLAKFATDQAAGIPSQFEQDRQARQEEEDRRSQQETDFFEGIRNRKEGRDLTPQQEAALIARNASLT